MRPGRPTMPGSGGGGVFGVSDRKVRRWPASESTPKELMHPGLSRGLSRQSTCVTMAQFSFDRNEAFLNRTLLACECQPASRQPIGARGMASSSYVGCLRDFGEIASDIMFESICLSSPLSYSLGCEKATPIFSKRGVKLPPLDLAAVSVSPTPPF